MHELTEMVCRAVRAIPPGRVATYGDVAELVGCTARQVGRILAIHGADTPWWRVVNASGRLPPHLMPEARRRWAAEGINVEQDAAGVPLRRYRAEPKPWADRAGLADEYD